MSQIVETKTEAREELRRAEGHINDAIGLLFEAKLVAAADQLQDALNKIGAARERMPDDSHS